MALVIKTMHVNTVIEKKLTAPAPAAQTDYRRLRGEVVRELSRQRQLPPLPRRRGPER